MPIWTYQVQLPPAKFVFVDDHGGHGGRFAGSGGCVICGATIPALAAVLQCAVEANALVRIR